MTLLSASQPSRSLNQIAPVADYERKIKRHETVGDLFILPDMYVVVRIDAHRILPSMWSSFPDIQYPLSDVIKDALISTAKFTMACEGKYTAAFVHGDEISFLLDVNDRGSERRRNRIISFISSTASVGFHAHFQRPVAFHAKLSELPTHSHVVDYFLWQRRVAERNFLSRTLSVFSTQYGISKEVITENINKGNDAMMAKLEELGYEYLSFPAALRLGTLLYWESNQPDPCLVELQNLDMPDVEYIQLIEQITQQPGRRLNGNNSKIQTPDIDQLPPKSKILEQTLQIKNSVKKKTIEVKASRAKLFPNKAKNNLKKP
jgi:tRNA(His) 5'-end guanylyltransferase